MIGFDSYTLQARLVPVLLVVLPVGTSMVAWFPEKFTGWGLLAGIATSFGLTALFAQIGRDQGLRKQSVLFQRWGGKPTTQLLRHRDNNLDEITKARYHGKLAKLIPSIEMPSRRKETTNPAAADAVYESCTNFLLEATRDKKRFPLIFAENVSYGLRRNLWGMKPAGIFLSLSGMLASAGAVVSSFNERISPPAIAAVVLNIVLLVLWSLRVTPRWVHTVAFAFAARLLAACENLEPTSNS